MQVSHTKSKLTFTLSDIDQEEATLLLVLLNKYMAGIDTLYDKGDWGTKVFSLFAALDIEYDEASGKQVYNRAHFARLKELEGGEGCASC